MVKRKIVWSPQAKLDLFNILDFFHKRNGTKTYSKKLYSVFRKSIRLLARHAEIGKKTDVPDTRALIINNYFVFYEIKTEIVEIITIWDSRQDPGNLKIRE